MEPNRDQARSEARGRRQQEAFSAAQIRPYDRAERDWGPGFGTVVAQLGVPDNTALRKCCYKSYLRRADLAQRRGQDTNTPRKHGGNRGSARKRCGIRCIGWRFCLDRPRLGSRHRRMAGTARGHQGGRSGGGPGKQPMTRNGMDLGQPRHKNPNRWGGTRAGCNPDRVTVDV